MNDVVLMCEQRSTEVKVAYLCHERAKLCHSFATENIVRQDVCLSSCAKMVTLYSYGEMQRRDNESEPSFGGAKGENFQP